MVNKDKSGSTVFFPFHPRRTPIRSSPRPINILLPCRYYTLFSNIVVLCGGQSNSKANLHFFIYFGKHHLLSQRPAALCNLFTENVSGACGIAALEASFDFSCTVNDWGRPTCRIPWQTFHIFYLVYVSVCVYVSLCVWVCLGSFLLFVRVCCMRAFVSLPFWVSVWFCVMFVFFLCVLCVNVFFFSFVFYVFICCFFCLCMCVTLCLYIRVYFEVSVGSAFA